MSLTKSAIMCDCGNIISYGEAFCTGCLNDAELTQSRAALSSLLKDDDLARSIERFIDAKIRSESE